MVTRLGEGLAQAGELTPDAVSRTVEAIGGLVDDARRGGPLDVVAVGTAGLRQAPTGTFFVDAVHRRCAVTVEVIRARRRRGLAYVAAVSSLPLVEHQRLMVFDSGGGSSQFTFGSPGRIDEQFSLDVGAVRFTERFGLTQAVPRGTVDDALAAIAADLEGPGRPAEAGPRGRDRRHVHRPGSREPRLGHLRPRRRPRHRRHHGRGGPSDRGVPAADGRGAPGASRALQPARAEVILAGACIVRTILTLTGQDAVMVSDRGLRHGVVTERFGAAGRA